MLVCLWFSQGWRERGVFAATALAVGRALGSVVWAEGHLPELRVLSQGLSRAPPCRARAPRRVSQQKARG